MDIDTTQTLLILGDACAKLVDAAPLMTAEPVALAALAGRVAAVDVVTTADLPTWANSALDGFAVRAAEIAAGSLPIAFEISAGDDPPPLAPGAAAGIATGGLIPSGADAVVPIERIVRDGDRVAVVGAVAPGDGVRAAGADLPRGAVVVAAGQRFGPVSASAIAAAGLDGASCARRPRVVVLTTGDELVTPGGALRRGQIHDSNSTLIALTLAQFGCEIMAIDRVPDTLAETERLFASALADADLVVSTGGVSVGPRDHVKPALAALAVEQLFWRVAIQPGKPTWAGRAPGGAIVTGLPGNPLSALAALHLLLEPLVAAMIGAPPATRRSSPLAAPVRRLATRLRALPARVVDGAVVVAADGSHQIARAANAELLALVPRGDGPLAAGSFVETVDLRGRP